MVAGRLAPVTRHARWLSLSIRWKVSSDMIKMNPLMSSDEQAERMFIELMTSDRKLEASREGSKFTRVDGRWGSR